jgi:DNA-binding response OmpR family regulator
MADNNGFTPTHLRILEVLKDGKLHPKRELVACLWDELSEEHALNRHISTLKGQLRKHGQAVDCVIVGNARHYRLVKPQPFANW